jgi:hypothetical protein
MATKAATSLIMVHEGIEISFGFMFGHFVRDVKGKCQKKGGPIGPPVFLNKKIALFRKIK